MDQSLRYPTLCIGEKRGYHSLCVFVVVVVVVVVVFSSLPIGLIG